MTNNITNNKNFIHLHNHTDHSVLDGMCRIPDLVKRAKELGMESAAITDHGTMSGVLEFYQTAKAEGIKPIVGSEVYCVPDMNVRESRGSHHLVLIAKDRVGYSNLVKISSAGYIDGFYYKPRADLDLISQHSEGLIAMTACVAGYVPSMSIQGNLNEAKAELLRLKDIFGKDLYIEVMDHGLTDQGLANPGLIKLGKEFEIPIVATNDCHYINADDHIAHDVLLCIQTKKTLSDIDRFRFGSDQFHFKTAEEMAKIFPDEYFMRTLEVAEKCNLQLDLGANHFPVFITPDGSAPESYLWKRMQKVIAERFGGNMNVWRHSFAYHMIRGRTKSAYLQQLMGHRDIRTTMAYLRLTQTDVSQQTECLPNF